MKLVDKGARLGNFIIDTIIICIIIIPVIVLIAFIYPDIYNPSSPAFEMLASFVFFSYYFLLEFFLGKTVGKMLTKTFVVDRNGNKPKLLNIVVRSLVRLIPIEGISFLFGTLGFHDLISGTRVVKNEKANTVTT